MPHFILDNPDQHQSLVEKAINILCPVTSSNRRRKFKKLAYLILVQKRMSISEACEVCGISPITGYRYIRRIKRRLAEQERNNS